MKPSETSSCPLCKFDGALFYEDQRHIFYQCGNCLGIFRSSELLLTKTEEKKRYLLHQCSNRDLGYLNFVDPVIDHIESHFSQNQIGLDYGCGHQPTLSNHLTKKGFEIKNYDPFFYDEQDLLKESYDFIVCCEVMEHFFTPDNEFQRLYGLLNPGGALVAMTHMFDKAIDFSNWYYKNDPTHVFIYSRETLEWISQNYGFKRPKIKDRLIIFEK